MGNRKRPARKRYAQIIRSFFIIFTLVWGAAVLLQTVSARTYVITDGSKIVTYTTSATDPEEVLEQAGLTMAEHDSYVTHGRSAITVCRARRILVVYHGESRQVSSPGESVGELLERLGITPGEGDRLSHSLSSLTYDGMELRVDAVVRRQETYTATIPHETEYYTAPALAAGTEEVLVRGRDGEVRRTAEVTYINGTEAERKVLSESVTIPAVSELVGVGTAPAEEEKAAAEPELVIGDGYILLPTGELLTYTRTDTVRATGYTHTDAGCDMITSTGTTVQRGTVAVDPRFIPYGTRMFIVSNDGEYVYGLAVAEDCGGAIKRDRMDLYFPTYNECIQFGFRRCTIYFLG